MGVLYTREGVELEPLITGGDQKRGLRAGTENVIGIAGMGKAAEIAVNHLTDIDRIKSMRDRLEQGIIKIIPDAVVNGHPGKRLPNTLNVIIPDMRGESLVIALDERGVAISSGSACTAGYPEPSHTLLAMGRSEEEAHCSLRFSIGNTNTMEEIEETLQILNEIVNEQEAIVRFVSCR